MTDSRAQSEERLEAARRLLVDAGITRASVSAEGTQNEIAVLRLDAAGVDQVAPLVGRIKQLGFRYVTIDLHSS